MTCEEFHIIACPGSGKLPNEMTRAERAAFIGHANTCPACNESLRKAAEAFVARTQAVNPALLEVVNNYQKTIVEPILDNDFKDEEFVKTATGKSL